MTICRHIRRPDPMPQKAEWIMRCDCGWEGRTAQFEGLTPRGRQEVEDALHEAFLAHLGPGERRTYLLCDTRRPDCFKEAGDFIIEARQRGSAISTAQAERMFNEQPQIIGNFVMPEGQPVLLLSSRCEDGVHWGTYLLGGEQGELPIGEVRTGEGRVFRLDQ